MNYDAVFTFPECQGPLPHDCPETDIAGSKKFLCDCSCHTEAVLEDLKNRREEC